MTSPESHHEDGQSPSAVVWTEAAVRQLGMTTDLTTAASVIGIGRTLAYDLARTGDFPVRILRLGRRAVIPVADLLAYLGITSEDRD
ncbi:MAG: hypothetical protein QG608_2658 [Actinomycetota bacterium]|nr:hypothetical protein [Actinomycetota bacterium]